MSRVIVLDSTPLGLLCHPNPGPTAVACKTWATALLANRHRLVLPEIVDYEVRREFLLNRRNKAIQYLDQLRTDADFLPLTTDTLRDAAQMWATIRRAGLPTAGPDALDIDVILAAQALSLNDPTVVIATSNVGHLSRLVAAEEWHTIPTT